jgi:7-carboxy-7-deazaguanine synthase (Cx14CxxC type)
MNNTKPYRVKELFYSLQGEGAWTGRPAVFCRFSKCNLWTGREADRESAVCQFCDTDFVGTDGQNGGVFADPESLVNKVKSLWAGDWPDTTKALKPYVIATGGEPLLQLDERLIDAFHEAGFEVGVETNGTLVAPNGIDWLCISPKADAEVVMTACDELKLVYPQEKAMPERFESMKARHFFLSPMAHPNADLLNDNTTQATMAYCLKHPQWRLSLQTHKWLGID